MKNNIFNAGDLYRLGGVFFGVLALMSYWYGDRIDIYALFILSIICFIAAKLDEVLKKIE